MSFVSLIFLSPEKINQVLRRIYVVGYKDILKTRGVCDRRLKRWLRREKEASSRKGRKEGQQPEAEPYLESSGSQQDWK